MRQPSLATLACYLRLDSEAVLPEGDLVQHVLAEDLVARLHIGQVDIGEEVREERQEPVPEVVGEIGHAVRPSEEREPNTTSALPSRIGLSKCS